MTSRLILVIGDLFIPDRAPVSDSILSFLPENTGLTQVPGYTTKGMAYSRYCIAGLYLYAFVKSLTHVFAVQEVTVARQDRPSPLSRQPHRQGNLRLPPSYCA